MKSKPQRDEIILSCVTSSKKESGSEFESKHLLDILTHICQSSEGIFKKLQKQKVISSVKLVLLRLSLGCWELVEIYDVSKWGDNWIFSSAQNDLENVIYFSVPTGILKFCIEQQPQHFSLTWCKLYRLRKRGIVAKAFLLLTGVFAKTLPEIHRLCHDKIYELNTLFHLNIDFSHL